MWGNPFLPWRAAFVDRWSGRTYNYHVYVPLQLCQEAARSGRKALFGLGWMVGAEIGYTQSCDSFDVS